MRHFYTLFFFLYLIHLNCLQAQVPLSQMEGFLELYMPQDNTSMYMGWKAGQNVDLSTRLRNTFIGSFTGGENINGSDNLFIGYQAGRYNLTGQENAFLGTYAGHFNIAGSRNVFVGDDVGSNNRYGADNVYIGHDAGRYELGYYNTFVGSEAGGDSDSTIYNSFFGNGAGYEIEGNYNTYLGARAGGSAEEGDYNTVIGYEAGYYNLGGENSFFGSLSGENNEGDRNTFSGYSSGRMNRTGGSNSFYGYESGVSNVEGNFNVFMGFQTGRFNVSGVRNVFMGAVAGENSIDERDQIFLGSSAGRSSIHGSNSVVIGGGAGFLDTAITNSVYVGYGAGQLPPSKLVSRTGNVFIGNFAGYDQEGDNKLFIANSTGDKTEALMYGEFDTGLLRVNGDLQIAANATNGNSRLLMKGIGGQLNEVIRYDGDENDVVIGSITGAGGKLFLRANTSTRISIIENGDVGIGTITPAYKLEVAGDGYFLNDITTGGTIYLNNVPVGASTTDLRLDGSGKVVKSTSDVRLKKDILTIPNALSKVLQLRGVQYIWKEDVDAGIQLGVIAQEVKNVVPEIVNETGGYFGVDYSETTGLFIEAIKEQQVMIKTQQKEIDALKSLFNRTLTLLKEVKGELHRKTSSAE